MPFYNDQGQPIGFPLPDWQEPPLPSAIPLHGHFCSVVPLDPARHTAALWTSLSADKSLRLWTYLPYGPLRDEAACQRFLDAFAVAPDTVAHAIIDRRDGTAAGFAAYLRLQPAAGSIEVGSICYAPRLQRTPAATEAMTLLMERAFTLGYRRYEWKCDALNAPSRAAAQRLGFTFEGIFRQATVTKKRNRDTAWFSILDSEWPHLRAAHHRWLAADNFDADGRQRLRLSDLTRAALARCRGELG